MTMVRVGRPPDGGWGWMVIAGAFLHLLVISMFSLGYSILFSEFLISSGASSTTIAWIFNLHLFLWNAFGVFTGPLTKELGFRTVSMTCTILASSCLLALVFADSIWFLLVFFALGGLFGGLGTKPCYLLLTLYFDRKRGLANAFLMTGACVAQFVGPLLIRYLLAEYSLKGATLILSGIVLNSVVGTALYQPVEWHMKKDDGEDPLKDEMNKNQKDKEGARETYGDEGVTEEMRAKEAERRKTMGVNLSRRASETSMLSLAVSNIDMSSIPPSSRRVSFALDDTITTSEDTGNRSSSLRGILTASVRVVNTVVSDLKILKSPRVLIIVLGTVCTINAYLNFLMMAPFAIQHIGYSLSEAARCMSMAAITNFCTRLLASSLTDQAWFNIRLAYMAGAFIIAVTTAVFGFLRDLTHIQVVLGVWGCGVGMNVSLQLLIMARVMGPDQTSAAFGVQCLVQSLAMIILGPLYGLIRDWSGSYPVSMVVMGATAGICVVLWCLMPAAIAYERKIEEKERREQEELERKV